MPCGSCRAHSPLRKEKAVWNEDPDNMSIYKEVKDHAIGSNWRHASGTYNDIVDMAFLNCNKTYNHAKRSKYDSMYHPHMGEFRQRRFYTSLAPSLCLNRDERVSDFITTPNKAYKPKGGEWLVERDRDYVMKHPRYPITAAPEVVAPRERRLTRCLSVPVSTTRFDNYHAYWRSRFHGLDYISPMLYPTDHRIAEDRRYQRIFFSPEFINITPSCRHATHLMMSAY